MQRRGGAMRFQKSAMIAIATALALTGPLSARAETVTYTYDARGRLKTAVTTGGATVTYSYDAAGNRTQVVVGTGSSNQVPVATDDSTDANAYYGGGPTYPDVTFDPRTNDSDPDSNPLTITGVTQPYNGSVTYTATSITYTYGTLVHPTGMDAELIDFDTFTYTISDGQGGTATATVNLNIVVW